jgi:hypothetical protein
VFFMHSASAVDIYRAQRKHINYSIWPMRISRHDLRRRYSNSLVIDAGSHFTLRARPARGGGGQGEQNTRGPECSEGPGNLGKMFVLFIIALYLS